MKFLINKPHLIFLLAIPIIMLIGILSDDAVLDINVHDTYYIIAYLHLATLISILFGIIGIGYWFMLKANRNLSKRLNLIHIALTFGGILLIWILAQLFRESIMEYNFNNNLTSAIYLIALIATFGQIIYPINIISGIIKKRNKTSG
ncbi:cbb3-type cytochrome c oxidase subunit I [Tenacibaculum aquimarinum]|uniref:cbb3-type cytochrome c oxidase subunit I n=1 Tax=Tenacibaculum aquimarinum TaxID=2910675 RepID=UPI001F0AB68B|nr:cbb3-type cytochrome c oxidase subunit I [Tenacibaculum aquimarinum]MCH3883419.1 cbb3-type cytochrome c oxidase subunit I [Tenacibaculum aquimarinum]